MAFSFGGVSDVINTELAIAIGVVVFAFFAVCTTCCCSWRADDFNRSNNSDIGTDWTEESGSWEINSNKLRSASTNATAVYSHEPDEDSYTILINFAARQTSGVFRVYARQNSSNYVCGEIKFGKSAFVDGSDVRGHIKIINCVSGSETTVSDLSILAGATEMRFCVDSTNGIVAFGVEQGETQPVGPVVLAELSPPGKEIAIGSGSSLNVSGYLEIDTFTVGKFSNACPDCYTFCADPDTYSGHYWPRFEAQLDFNGDHHATNVGTCSKISCELLEASYTLTLQGLGNRYDGGAAWWYKLDITTACGFQYVAVGVYELSDRIDIVFSKNAWGDTGTTGPTHILEFIKTDPTITGDRCDSGTEWSGINVTNGAKTVCWFDGTTGTIFTLL